MKVNIGREVAALKRMTVKELRGRYLDVFGETTRSGNKDWLWKRIAWRMQANAEGGLTHRVRRRANQHPAGQRAGPRSLPPAFEAPQNRRPAAMDSNSSADNSPMTHSQRSCT